MTPRLACFATQGTGSLDEARIHTLLEHFEPELLPFDRSAKRRSAIRLVQGIRSRRPDLVVMEGTGIAGGLGVIAARALTGTRYVVSSGDAVGPYLGLSSRGYGLAGAIYERLLCRCSAGFIAWSPYLAGRALTLGAPRAMTAANWGELGGGDDRARIREQLGIPESTLVFGLVGSLTWNRRIGYCYGQELVRAVMRTGREDVRVLVVGDGDGLPNLAELAGSERGRRVLLPGRVPREEVGAYLQAMDVASLPQSVDRVGSFRYTTKLSEYLAAGLPVVTSQIPAAYDLDDGWLWRLPGREPWSDEFIDALAQLMRSLTTEDIAVRAARVPHTSDLFDKSRQQRRVTDFINEIIEGRHRP